MLPARHRLRSAPAFVATVRRGRRCGGRLVAVHLASRSLEGESPAQVGFVVSKAVGSAVTRNLVKRRLRHLCRQRLDQLPVGSRMVVRALPGSGGAAYSELADELDRCLDGCLGPCLGSSARLSVEGQS
ncbi:MAG: ribonuclease P protein component [Actinomycetota bacterium]|nr:ribonuclease P protein component [Actinomycetota bacterium]